MRERVPDVLELCRVRDGERSSLPEWGFNGLFELPGGMKVICSDGLGWDHVSVSFPDRTPTWDEMCMVKDLCFTETECVIQYHPPKADYINLHPHCLHLWRPQFADVPRPPAFMVGPLKGGEA